MSTPANPPVLSEAEVIAAFLETKAEESRRIYRTTLTQWQAQCPHGLAQATTSMAYAWLATLESRQKSAKTRARTVHSLRSFYRFAQELDGWPRNPWALVPAPAVQEKPPVHILSAEELAVLFRTAARDPRAHAVIQLLLTTGLRVGELARAQWKDIRLSDDQQVVLAIPGAKARHVKLVDPVWAALLTYRRGMGLPEVRAPEDARPLIWGRSGRPVHPNTITELVAKVAREAELSFGSRVTASWLRAAHAVWAHQGGASPEDIQQGLGLQSRRSVDRYLAAAPPIGRTSADAVQDAIQAAGITESSIHEGHS